MWLVTLIGFAITAFYCFEGLRRLIRFFRGHFTKPTVDLRRFQTAVITGGSDGIGKAYACELARLGIKKIILIGRDEEKLKLAAQEVGSKVETSEAVSVKWIIADFAKVDIYDQIQRELEGADVDILVNNVGASINVQKRLDEMSRENCFKSININILSTVLMSQIVLPKMVAKRKGIVINMSSASVVFPPRFLLYATTKTFMSRFSYGLRLQYQKFGVIVQEVEPFLVYTKMARFVKGPFVVSPEVCAQQSLQTLGHYDNTHGAIRHEIQGFIFTNIPTGIVEVLQKRTERRAALHAEKQAREANK